MKRKKWIWSAICVLCALALTACAAPPSSRNGETTAQSTEGEITFSWDAKILPITVNTESGASKIQRLTYDSCKSIVDDVLKRHGVCDELNCALSEGECECRTVKNFNRNSYPEAFFRDSTLLLIDYGIAKDPFELSDVSCEGNVLTCTFTYYGMPPGSVENTGGGPSWTILVELDTVLPEGMEFAVKTNVVILEEEERLEKSNAFYKEYLE